MGNFLEPLLSGNRRHTVGWQVQKSGECSVEAWRIVPIFFCINGSFINNRWLALGFLNHQQYEIENLDLDFVGNLLIGSMKLGLYSFRSMNG